VKKEHKGMAKLAEKAVKVDNVPCTSGFAAESSNESEVEESSKKAKAARKRKHRKAEQAKQKSALDDIVQERRMSHQEAAVDLHRRQLLAKGLMATEEAQPDVQWSSFFDLETDTRAGPQAASSSQPSCQVVGPRHALEVEGETDQGPLAHAGATAGDDTLGARTRPTKRYEATSARSTQKAINKLIGAKGSKGACGSKKPPSH
jgi:hypothetical protein